MMLSIVATLAILTSSQAPAASGGEASASVAVDLRGILINYKFDKEKAAAAGLDVSRMQAPKPKKQVPPRYPDASLRTGRGGRAVTECRIDTEGVPRECRVASAADSLLGDAALNAIKQWRYEPLKVDGVPTPALIAIPMDFFPARR